MDQATLGAALALAGGMSKGGSGASLIAAPYSNTSTYSIGDHVIYDNEYYECIYTISTAEEWTPAHWKKVSVSEEIEDVKTDIQSMQPDATASDIGKALLVKTVADGKPTSWEYGEAGGGSVDPSAIASAVDDWCDENITNPSNPPLDRSLLSSSSAAPADLLGAVSRLEAVQSTKVLTPFVQGSINDSTGAIDDTDATKCHIGKINCKSGNSISYSRYNSKIAYVSVLFVYNTSGTLVTTVSMSNGDSYTFTADGMFAIRCGLNSATMEEAIASASQSFTATLSEESEIVHKVNGIDDQIEEAQDEIIEKISPQLIGIKTIQK